MKKQYISPMAMVLQLNTDAVILNGSGIGEVSTDTDNPIVVGGDATAGGSDSRRNDLWDDEEEEYY